MVPFPFPTLGIFSNSGPGTVSSGAWKLKLYEGERTWQKRFLGLLQWYWHCFRDVDYFQAWWVVFTKLG